MKEFIEVLNKYAVFSGRSRRREFWMFNLISTLICFGIGLVEIAIDSPGFMGLVYSLAILIPAISVSVRRLHDIGRSGWWIFINLVPLIGTIAYIVFLCSDSNPGTNTYGPSPKRATEG